MSRPSRRPSISIHDYPEHLNPFNDNNPSANMQMRKDNNKSTEKETKHKFWSFGKGRKKRSHSFSIKSTWNGLFGKCKEAPEAPERHSMITTVSTTYKRGETINSSQNGIRQSQTLRDQQEFDEALGTLTRRRKYTWDDGSRYNSSLTVNGDPARIYDGSPQETTNSIMGDLTPKPPARKFGQVSPKPKDKIPPLDFEGKEHLSNGYGDDREMDRAPIPPRRSGLRASQRFSPSSDIEEEGLKSDDVRIRDENENVPDDYVFKRFSQDAVRKSNLSINSCMSISSTASGYTRKKRRAPQPPKPKSPVENKEEFLPLTESKISPIPDPLEISRVAEDIEELTKKTQTDEDVNQPKESSPIEKNVDISPKLEITIENIKNSKESSKSPTELSSIEIKDENTSNNSQEESNSKKDEIIEVELRKKSEETLEIIKEITPSENDDADDLKKKNKSTLSRSNSFCVKDEIEKIEKKLNKLETRRKSEDSINHNSPSGRFAIEENRRHFFQDLVNDPTGVKVEIKELPREQNNCHVIRLTDPPIPIEAPQEPVKIIELHIEEPIRKKPEILADNPIPKPRRSSALSLERQPSIHGDIKHEDSQPKGSSL
ncbi:uncharacterized protein LOC122499538 [Leptopilina heterotoma]|uniref:uncharacterized protein LOC122499538 n=1 Tax=Leptopilina heterotoma TaxID=63436 RepID=UPI001CA8BAF3|nr:uncharacterized protein LOC122499538 [Leptopilina heterotoma]